MKKLTIAYILVIGVFVASCGSKSSQEETTKNKPIIVKTQKVSSTNSAVTLQFSGKVKAINSAEISTKFITNITKLHVNVGDKVKKGTTLITLDALDIKAQLAQADAQVRLATAHYNNTLTNFNRFKNLYEANSASKKEFDDMQTQLTISISQLEAAKQQKKQIQAQIQYTQITAPFNGIVTAKFVNEGDITKPGMPLLVVEDDTNYEIAASVSESEIALIKPNLKVIVTIPAMQITFPAILKELSVSSSNTGNQYVAVFSIPNLEEKLFAGMHAKIATSVKAFQNTNTIKINKNALITKGELTGVYTVSNNKTAILRWIQIGDVYENEVEVLSGLNTSDTYIIKSDGKLFNGANITFN